MKLNMKLSLDVTKLEPKQRLYKISVPIIALTGGIGSGKSSVTKILRSFSLPVICADELVKEVYQLEQVKKEIYKLFPMHISKKSNSNKSEDNSRSKSKGNSDLLEINFKSLRQEVFASSDKKRELEKIIYSYLPQAFKKALSLYTSFDYIIYDVPLLFEKNLNSMVDYIICVYSSQKQQLERTMSRDASEQSTIENIIKQQTNIETKKELADFVIDNSGSKVQLKKEVESFISLFFS